MRFTDEVLPKGPRGKRPGRGPDLSTRDMKALTGARPASLVSPAINQIERTAGLPTR